MPGPTSLYRSRLGLGVGLGTRTGEAFELLELDEIRKGDVVCPFHFIPFMQFYFFPAQNLFGLDSGDGEVGQRTVAMERSVDPYFARERTYGSGESTHSLTHSLTQSLTYSLTQSLTQSLTHATLTPPSPGGTHGAAQAQARPPPP